MTPAARAAVVAMVADPPKNPGHCEVCGEDMREDNEREESPLAWRTMVHAQCLNAFIEEHENDGDAK